MKKIKNGFELVVMFFMGFYVCKDLKNIRKDFGLSIMHHEDFF